MIRKNYENIPLDGDDNCVDQLFWAPIQQVGVLDEVTVVEKRGGDVVSGEMFESGKMSSLIDYSGNKCRAFQ